MIDVFFEYGKADYLDLSGKTVLPISFTNPGQDKNLESFVVGYKAWNLIGDYVYNPSFYYEINRTMLAGKSRRVFFKTISKYPDLVRRYNAIRPSSVNFVVRATLRTTDGKATTAHFKVSDNALAYFESRSAKNLQSPISPASGKWKYAFSTYGDFTDKDASDENELKQILKNLREVQPVGPNMVGIDLDIKWADDAIDEIGKLYDQYEKESKKIDDELKAVKNADKLVKPVAAYNKDDEMSAPFEEEAKSAEVFKDGETVGLRAKGKIVFSSSQHTTAEPINSEKNLFKFRSRKGDWHLYNAKGKRLSVDGNSNFRLIEAGNRTGTYRLLAAQEYSTPFYETRYNIPIKRNE